MSIQPDHALVISCRRTLVTHDGAAEYLTGFVRSLSRAGFEVSIIFIEEIPDRMARIRLVPRYRALFARYRMLRTIPFGGYHYSTNVRRWLRLLARRVGLARFFPEKRAAGSFGLEFNKVTREGRRWARTVMQEMQPSLVVANYFNAAEIFDEVPAGAVKSILVHDVLTLRRESFDAAGTELDFDPSLVPVEAAAFASADICFTIKEEEAAYIRTIAPNAAVVTLPVLVEVGDESLEDERAPVCIFVGGDNPCNNVGVPWFVREVWPRVIQARPDARFHIVGAVGKAVPRPLPDGVEVLGFVADLDKEYARAAVAVTPLLFGSGVKIKLIEGMAAGLPSVATSVGAEGVVPAPGEILRIEDSPEGFADAVVAAFAASDAGRLRAAAREFAREHYDQTTVGVGIINQLRDLGRLPSSKTARAGK